MLAKAESLKWEDWYLHAERDFQNAKLLTKYQGTTDTVAFLLQQTAEKYLKGYLLKHGWTLKKTHDLELLITLANKHNNEFAEFLDYSRLLSATYVESRYPLGPPKDYSDKQISDWIDQTKKLISFIKEQKG